MKICRFSPRLETRSRVNARGILLGTVCLGATFVTPAFAQTATNSGQIEEIVVTAQKVAQPLSKAPVTVSALTGADLESRGYQTLDDLKGVIPGVQINDYMGELRTNIRGIGQNSLSLGVDAQNALTVNGVYIADQFGADEDFLDIDRIEVLRGPQGTLYGRNATGGAINIITNKPTEDFEGSAQLTYGNYGEIDSQLVLSGALDDNDKILGRFAAGTEDHDGYSLDLANGQRYDNLHRQAFRGTLLFNLANNVTFDLVADYTHELDGSNAVHLLGLSPGYPTLTGVVLGGQTVPLNAEGLPIHPREIDYNTLPDTYQWTAGVTGDLTWQINDALTFKSLSSWRKAYESFDMSFNQTTAVFPSGVPGKDMAVFDGSEQESQEFQLIGKSHWVDFVTGLYYFHDYVSPGYFNLGINVGTVPMPYLASLQLGGTDNTSAYAAYGQATVKLTDKLHIDAGLRYSMEKRSATSLELLPAFGVDATDARSITFHDLSPKVTVDYQATDQLMAYATVAKGFQSGGFDISASPPLVPFKAEIVWDYEGGIKYHTDWANFDVAAYHYNYANLQVAQIVNGLPLTNNAASSTVNGAEASVTVKPTQALTITTSLAYTEAKFTSFTEIDPLTSALDDLSGNELPGSAKFSSNVYANYVIPFGRDSLALAGEWNYHDRVYFTEFNSNEVSQAPMSTFNASASYNIGDKWLVTVYGKNLTNRVIPTSAWITGGGFGSMVLGTYAPPLTYGVTLHVYFQ
jgi:iron complex outermembrane receptor protein